MCARLLIVSLRRFTVRQQVNLTTPLYARRHKTVSQIPNFWPLVLEQAPPDIDQYIQPSDSALLLSSLTSLSVRHFQLEETPAGDPRSVSIRWEFAENEYFEDEVLEKKFWYRRAKDGWCGLVSEPVCIKWKKGKDLTGGLLDLVCKAWEADLPRQQEHGSKSSSSSSSSSSGSPSAGAEGGDAKEAMTTEQKALKKKINQTGMGGLSFFAWFGFIGRRVSAKESEEATRREAERREGRRQGQKIESPVENEPEEGEGPGMSLEIFQDGDDLAVAITEDLWPGAIKYFSESCAISTPFFPFPSRRRLHSLHSLPQSIVIIAMSQARHLANTQQSRHRNKTPSPTQTLNPTRKAPTKKSQKTPAPAADHRRSEDHNRPEKERGKLCIGGRQSALAIIHCPHYNGRIWHCLGRLSSRYGVSNDAY
jgi:hypothetical protein